MIVNTIVVGLIVIQGSDYIKMINLIVEKIEEKKEHDLNIIVVQI